MSTPIAAIEGCAGPAWIDRQNYALRQGLLQLLAIKDMSPLEDGDDLIELYVIVT